MILPLLKSYLAIDGRSKLSILLLLLVGGIIGSFMEVIGLSLIFPLINVISNPEMIGETGIVSKLYYFFNFESSNSFLIFLTLAVAGVFIAKSFYMLGLYYIQSYFINRWQFELADRLFNMYIYAPFSMHLSRNSAELIRNLGLTSSLYNGIVFSIISLFIEGTVFLSIIIILIYYNPYVTITIFFMLSIITATQHKYMGNFFNRIGIDNSEIVKQNTKCMYQSLGAVKETKILGREKYFINIFHGLQKRNAKNNHQSQFVSRIPTAVNELSIMTIMAVSILVVLFKSNGVDGMMATLGLLAVAAIRILPLVSKVLVALNSIAHNRHVVQLLESDVSKLSQYMDSFDDLVENVAKVPIVPLLGDIELHDISFTYPNSSRPSLQNISLTIKRGEFVGLVGVSGSGKTTLADIILGLHTIDAGMMIVNGNNISQRKEGHSRINAGYVPQTIYITDDTIQRNIAFGVPDNEIDNNRMKDAIEIAQLTDFVKSLAKGIETNLGEGGNSVSVGQRQRIGIARALYHQPELLVLDEATSSLDASTERYITETFESLKGDKTVIAIAHRLYTLKNCDRLFFLHDGHLIDSGTFGELFERNASFRHAVELGQL